MEIRFRNCQVYSIFLVLLNILTACDPVNSLLQRRLSVIPLSTPSATLEVVQNVDQSFPSYDPNAKITTMVQQAVMPVDMAQQMSFLPPEGVSGNFRACGAAQQNDARPFLVTPGRAGPGQLVTFCYGNLSGDITEEVVDPNGNYLRNLVHLADERIYASDFVVFPDDIPGIYTAIAKTSQGEFKVQFEVTEEADLSAVKQPFALRLQSDRYQNFIGGTKIEEVAYLYVGGFEPEQVIDIGFYEGCNLKGGRRYLALGSNLVISAKAQVNKGGYAFLLVPESIVKVLRSVEFYNIYIGSGGLPPGRSSVTDPLGYKSDQGIDGIGTSVQLEPIMPQVIDDWVVTGFATTFPPCPSTAPSALEATTRDIASITPSLYQETDISPYGRWVFDVSATTVRMIPIETFGRNNDVITIDTTSGGSVVDTVPTGLLPGSIRKDNITYSTHNNRLQALTNNGDLIWEVPLIQPTTYAPLIDDQVLYVADVNHTITLYDSGSGTQLTSFSAPSGWESIKSLGYSESLQLSWMIADNTLYLGGEDKKILCTK